ncbi:MAG: glycerate kinase [Candidatus Riflebacteria bacterium HGW-Riflebacteria-2]|jgi:glycerate-2-kinase|nr:MAG: glycerate kinase [Candidatus Riflebacteria bacterium HGW-Riflebacteria-2]
MYVKNLRQLSGQAVNPVSRRLRAAALQAYNSAICAVAPARLMRSELSLCNHILAIGDSRFDISAGRVFVIGGGKASAAMAAALEDLLGEKLAGGSVNIPPETVGSTRLVVLNRSGHPIPDQAGVEGSRRIIELAERAGADDLVVCLVSGGGSSLMPLPGHGVSLADKQQLTFMLLRTGASIGEMNAVRKHLSGIKGGWLARRAFPARLINLILSDVIGDPLDVIASGPTVPDPTTFADAMEILQRYEIWHDSPETVRKLLTDGSRGLVEETPKPGDAVFERVSNHVIGNNFTALAAAGESLADAGFRVEMIRDQWQGDARELARNLAARALAATRSNVPVALVFGGEATVRVTGTGRGGRNQHAALAAVRDLAGYDNLLLAMLATDGIDGPTDACGALVDGSTLARAHKMGMTPEAFLQNNDSYSFFNALGELMHTGYTGSNVNDIYLILSAGSSAF